MVESNATDRKAEKVFALAQWVFGDLLVDVGVGGSLARDIDTVVVLRKVDLVTVGMFLKKGGERLRQPLSCRVLTPLMIEAGLVDGKTATMLLKGMVFKNGGDCFARFDRKKLRDIVKKNLGDEISGILRAVVEGKYDEGRALDLLVQLLAICR